MDIDIQIWNIQNKRFDFAPGVINIEYYIFILRCLQISSNACLLVFKFLVLRFEYYIFVLVLFSSSSLNYLTALVLHSNFLKEHYSSRFAYFPTFLSSWLLVFFLLSSLIFVLAYNCLYDFSMFSLFSSSFWELWGPFR